MSNRGPLVELLNQLIAADFDSMEAYGTAVEHLEDPALRRQLSSFMADHERHVIVLSELVRGLGAEPLDHGDLRRLVTKARVLFGNVVGDSGILAAMRSNEQELHQTYAEALKTPHLPEDVREVLKRHCGDEHRHQGWVDVKAAEGSKDSAFPAPAYETT